MKKAFITLDIFFTLLLLYAAVLCQSITALARDGAAYLDGFYRYANTAASGVSSEEYPALALGLAGYFRAERDTPQVTVQRFGIPGEAYSEKELTHLQDLRHLFAMLEHLQEILWPLLCILLIFSLLWGRRQFTRAENGAALLGILLFFTLLGALALWAASDFNAFFYQLHRLLFRNDFWLLDPAKDLLIQLMPEPFFTHFTGRVLARLALPFACTVLAGGGIGIRMGVRYFLLRRK